MKLIWTLQLRPSQWATSLIFPLNVETPSTIRLANDPAQLSADMLDDVAYMMQACRRHVFILLTEDPRRILDWMRNGDERFQLVQRMVHVEWGVAIKAQSEADFKMPLAIDWPVRHRWIQSPEPPLELSPWMQHPFSTVGHTGVCEDCGVGKHESIMHTAAAPAYFKRVEYATT